MSISKKIRLQGKESLKNNWTSAITALFVLLATGFAVFALVALSYYILNYFKIDTLTTTIITLSLGLLGLVLVSPVCNGILKYFYDLSETNEPDISKIFYFIKGKKYLKTIIFNLYNSIYLFVFAIILIASVLVSSLMLKGYIFNLVTSIVSLICILGIIVFGLRQFTAQLLYADNSDETLSYYNFASKTINKHHYSDMFKLFLCFVPWLALCYFILPIFYVLPYALSSFATSGKWLIKIYKDGKMV